MSEKLCLKWNDFQDNTNTAFASLRNDTDLTDVTLACKDGEQIQAHKVILAAASPFFLNLLRTNKHPHPLIYMRGLKAEDLVAIVDFLYYGEANVYQENLDAFLAVAEDLELKGLCGNNGNEAPKEVKTKPRKNNEPMIYKSETIRPNVHTVYEKQIENETAVAVQNYEVWSVNISDVQELDEKVKSMMTKSENTISNGTKALAKAAICTVCGKEGLGTNIRKHIEANHLEGVSIPCNLCGNLFRTKQSLARHACAKSI